ncbi:hypothetical protein ACWPKO_20225 (plasmid) [Coraliomargarita sp. W4R53]
MLVGPDDSTRVLDALSGRVWRDAEDVARRSGLMREEVESLLGILALEARVASGAGGWRRQSE